MKNYLVLIILLVLIVITFKESIYTISLLSRHSFIQTLPRPIQE